MTAIVTQQSSAEITRIIDLSASKYGNEKYSQKPLSLAEKFSPEAHIAIQTLIEEEFRLQEEEMLNFFPFLDFSTVSSGYDDADEINGEIAGYDNLNPLKRPNQL